MTTQHQDPAYAAALEAAAELLGGRLEPFLVPGPGEPANAADFARPATVHTFGDAWPRTEVLDVRTRALVSVTVAATLGTRATCCDQMGGAEGVRVHEIVDA